MPTYPYMHPDGNIRFAPATDEFMVAAKQYAQQHSLDKVMPNASVIAKDGAIIGRGANGSTYHENNECERVKQGIPSGRGYELCEGCHPKNHSEPTAIADAKSAGNDTTGATLYLWGHYWCCEPCWHSMLDAGIKDVVLLENSELLFDKSKPGNIVGHQFENKPELSEA